MHSAEQKTTSILSLYNSFYKKSEVAITEKDFHLALRCCTNAIALKPLTAEQVRAVQLQLMLIGEECFKRGVFIPAVKAAKLVMSVQGEINEDNEELTQEEYDLVIAKLISEANLLAGKAAYAYSFEAKSITGEEANAAERYFDFSVRFSKNADETREEVKQCKNALKHIYEKLPVTIQKEDIATFTFEKVYQHSLLFIKANTIANQNKGTCLADTAEQREQGIKTHLESLEFYNKSFYTFNSLGMLYLSKGIASREQHDKVSSLLLAIHYLTTSEKLSKGNDSTAFLYRAWCYFILDDFINAMLDFENAFNSMAYGDMKYDEILSIYQDCQKTLLAKRIETINLSEKKLSDLKKILQPSKKVCKDSKAVFERATLLDHLGLFEFAAIDYEFTIWLLSSLEDTCKTFTVSLFEIRKKILHCKLNLIKNLIAEKRFKDSVKYFIQVFDFVKKIWDNPSDQTEEKSGSKTGLTKTTSGSMLSTSEKMIDILLGEAAAHTKSERFDQAEEYLHKIINATAKEFTPAQFKTTLSVFIQYFLKKSLSRAKTLSPLEKESLNQALQKAILILPLDIQTIRWLNNKLAELVTDDEKKQVQVSKSPEQPKEKKSKPENIKQKKSEMALEAPKSIIDETLIEKNNPADLTEPSPAASPSPKTVKPSDVPDITRTSFIPSATKEPQQTSEPTPKTPLPEQKTEEQPLTPLAGIKILHPKVVENIYLQFKKQGITRVYTVGGYVCEAIKHTGNATDYDFVFGSQSDPLTILKTAFPDAIITSHNDQESDEDKFFIVKLVEGVKFDVCCSKAFSNQKLCDRQALLEDAKKRDFTANALYATSNGEVFDPIGRGYYDLDRGQLKMIKQMSESFADDPIRALRAINFCKKRKWKITDKMFAEIERLDIKTITEKLIRQNPGRTNSWILKLLSNGYAHENFEEMLNHKLLEKIFPQLAELINRDNTIRKQIFSYLRNIDNQVKQGIKPSLNEIYFRWAQVIAVNKISITAVCEMIPLFKNNFSSYEKLKREMLEKDPGKIFNIIFFNPILAETSNSFVDIKTTCLQRLLTNYPEKANVILRHMFIHGEAENNFVKLFKQDVFKVLLPSLSKVLFDQKVCDFLQSQLIKADIIFNQGVSRPSFDRIYATWIVTMAKVTNQSIEKIIQSETLFKTHFPRIEKIEETSLFQSALADWNNCFLASPAEMRSTIPKSGLFNPVVFSVNMSPSLVVTEPRL